MLSSIVTDTRGIVSYATAVGLAQFSLPENGLSGIRGGILGTGRLQHRQILSVGCVPMKFKTEARRGERIIEWKKREIYANIKKNLKNSIFIYKNFLSLFSKIY